MSLHGDHEGGAAKRRRDRRLRMHWRHEQLTLQMALAAALHHSRDVGPVTYNALRSQKTARAEATNNAPRSQMSSVAGDTELFSLCEDELGGTRPDRLYEVRPQERDQRHTVEQIVDTVLFVPSLDVPVPQMENQLVDECRFLDVLIPSRLSKCPRSRLHPVLLAGAVCASLSRRQNSWCKYRRSSPILLCCSELWSRTSTFQFLVVEGETSVLKVLLPDRVLQRSLPLRNAVLSGLWSRSCAWWRPSRFSPSPGFFSVFFEFS